MSTGQLQAYPQAGYPQTYDPNMSTGQPIYYQPQLAQPNVVTVSTTQLAYSDEGKKAEEAFMMALVISLIMWFLGLGFCCSCFFFIPVMRYRQSLDERARRYGQYGLAGFAVTLVLNLVILMLIIIPIIIAVAVTAATVA